MVLQRDYIIRLIREFSSALGSIAKKRRAGQITQAVEEIAKASRTHLGIDSDYLLTLSTDELAKALRLAGGTDDARLLIAADLILELSQLRSEDGSTEATDETTDLRRRAFDLYVTALESVDLGPDESSIYVERAQQLYTTLAGAGLDSPVVGAWFNVCVAQRQYARAEDILFDLVEADPSQSLMEMGKAFYRHLKDRPDAELVAAGLPLDEVESGEKSFLQSFSSTSDEEP